MRSALGAENADERSPSFARMHKAEPYATTLLRAAVCWGERRIVYCPQCRCEYRDGFSECSDCRVPLLAGTPPQKTADPALGLVVVLETNDQILIAFAKGLLEEAGIPFFILGQIATLVS